MGNPALGSISIGRVMDLIKSSADRPQQRRFESRRGRATRALPLVERGRPIASIGREREEELGLRREHARDLAKHGQRFGDMLEEARGKGAREVPVGEGEGREAIGHDARRIER